MIDRIAKLHQLRRRGADLQLVAHPGGAVGLIHAHLVVAALLALPGLAVDLLCHGA